MIKKQLEQAPQSGRELTLRQHRAFAAMQVIEALVQTEQIHGAAVFITEGMRERYVVVGPKQDTPTIIPDDRSFAGPAKVLGVGTMYPDNQGLKLHLHAGLGKGDHPVVGCLRGHMHSIKHIACYGCKGNSIEV